ncbi:exodeoxyribonuclease V subunit alpha [candidate division KSB1 bacterium]|nr:exodeoxyribonuclease V subunit alpha [candidate division KSB1 bacterium]NIR69888.1 exodeoxyribonuclease V subunit alpha [candidate division KSB1 bacterium]NIS28041.1 exodeoxyribonuclease V subunit alpha [candidate division KSB1 bacterium]NIT74912.1 exodeoxyribonuclease V subunit alpha [candidate division KSB1 bacterium]NIU28696.1 exodeoxyribonuclease V subunit alpha [candidate division KSB1 bacterium]
MKKLKEPALLQPSETISQLDIHFARLMLRLSGRDDGELYLAAALVSSQNRAGHVCLDLSELENPQFLQEKFGEDFEELPIPSVEKMTSVLSTAAVVGKPGDFQPLVLDARNRLYLNRYWEYQERLAQFINHRTRDIQEIADSGAFQGSLADYFGENEQGIDWQRIAAITAMLKKFCVITGGPGTGKTYTVAKILALFLEQFNPESLRIILAAPTGKAAVRLQESIKQVKKELSYSDEIKKAIPEEASTIHRLLGYIPHSPYFRHNQDHPLEVDVMIVDEASMVDLALMSKLVQALPPDARLILLGDNNQLASVEAGAVLADICDTGQVHTYSREFMTNLETVYGQKLQIEAVEEKQSGIRDCIVQLQRSYRFESQKGIGEVSRAVNLGDGERAFELLTGNEFADIEWHSLGSENILKTILEDFRDYTISEETQELFRRFERFRILCAVKEGPQGVHAINRHIERYIKRQLRIGQRETVYPGQPILITQNDYNLKLFNGDVGIILPDPDSNHDLKAHFPGPRGMLRKFRPFRLPEYETAYAMTVHKSQGSEFERVLLLLPEKDSPILTRELIYTGITRAARKVEIWGNEAVFQTAVSRRIKRSSGLRDALWEVSAGPK